MEPSPNSDHCFVPHEYSRMMKMYSRTVCAATDTTVEQSVKTDFVDKLTKQLLIEAFYGRDAVRLPTFLLPGVTLAALAVYRTNPQRN